MNDSKHSAFSTNHLTDIDKTKCNYNQQQHKNLNSQTRKLLTNTTEKPHTPWVCWKDFKLCCCFSWWWWWWFEKLCSPALTARNSHERATDTPWQ